MNSILRTTKLGTRLSNQLRKDIVYITRNRSTSTDQPVKFSASKAANWKAEFSRQGINSKDESVWFQPISVCASLAVFLLYFCVLREENDIDEVLGTSLYERIDGLEESQLKVALSFYRDTGRDTKAIEARLAEIAATR